MSRYYRLSVEGQTEVCGIYDNKHRAIAHALEMSIEKNKEYEIVEVIGQTHRITNFEFKEQTNDN